MYYQYTALSKKKKQIQYKVNKISVKLNTRYNFIFPEDFLHIIFFFESIWTFVMHFLIFLQVSLLPFTLSHSIISPIALITLSLFRLSALVA